MSRVNTVNRRQFVPSRPRDDAAGFGAKPLAAVFRRFAVLLPLGRIATLNLRVAPVEHLRILVVDDHEIVRSLLRHLLEAESGWEVCGEASDGEEAVGRSKTLHPDIHQSTRKFTRLAARSFACTLVGSFTRVGRL